MTTKEEVLEEWKKWRKSDKTIYHSITSITSEEIVEWTIQTIQKCEELWKHSHTKEKYTVCPQCFSDGMKAGIQKVKSKIDKRIEFWKKDKQRVEKELVTKGI